jgi:hypothetical protein
MLRRISGGLGHGFPTRFILAALVVMAMPLNGQIPDTFVNLKVLPPDITKAELVETMKGFTKALGVRCEFCHYGEGTKLSDLDFPSDKRSHKVKARVMLQMLAEINGKYLPMIKDDDNHSPAATCRTCHRGKQMPEE